MDNIIKITDENGNIAEAEVLDIFTLDEYNHTYCIYTFNEQIDDNNYKIYISILEQTNNTNKFLNIEDNNEWNKVQEYLENISKGE